MLRKLYEDLSPSQRINTIAMVLIVIGALGHHVPLFFWYIEDAAISFAYSKHLAMGEGLVPFIGGERVEGYSNPAWVFLLAPFSWVFDLHEFVKFLQVIMVIPTVVLTWFSAREVLGRDNHLALLAPATLAASSQFALWSGAGLEMGLMDLLMAAALWRTLVEVRTGEWPWSALLWLGVTLCRPEAILYAAVAGFCAMLFQFHAGRGVLPTLKWLATFFVPFGLYHAWRYDYFAWELPNTYYAKLERRNEFPFLDWNSKAWKYTRNFMFEVGWGFFLPVWVLGIIGHERWRFPTAAVVSLVLGLSIAFGGDQRVLLLVLVAFMLVAFWLGLRHTEEQPPRGLALGGLGVAVALIGASELLRYFGFAPSPIPTWDWVGLAPAYLLLAASVGLAVMSYGTPQWQARLLTWMLCWAAVGFALLAQWDWMKGFRWFAPAVVPGAVLFALGASSLGYALRDLFKGDPEADGPVAPDGFVYGVGSLMVAVCLIPNVVHTVNVARAPDTEPRDVRMRVNYVNQVRNRLHVDERFVDLDVDQGAHLYWSDFEMMDIAGLIEVPLAHHKFERPFLKEHLFKERRPHFIHIHGGWASSSRIPSLPEFRREYVEIPGYVANRKQFHIGNHIRRDILLQDRWPHSGHPPVALDEGVVVHGVKVPSEPAVGGHMHLHIGLSSSQPRKKQKEDDFRVVAFASSSGGDLHTWDLAPGYDWIFPNEWRGEEVFVGRVNLRLPDTLEPGRYDLGLVVFGSDGRVLEVTHPDDLPNGVLMGGSEGHPARFANGELVFGGQLTILSVEDRNAAADEDLRASVAASESGKCDEAAEKWALARWHRPADRAWADAQRRSAVRPLADCLARQADTLSSREDRVAALVAARKLDHWSSEYRQRARPLAEELFQEGLAAFAVQDWEAAYRLFADAVDVDRSRSWARRYAEEARAYRLEIDDASLAKKEAEKEERRVKAKKQRADAEKKRQALLEKRKALEKSPRPTPKPQSPGPKGAASLKD